MIDFTNSNSILKHFKLQQFNIISCICPKWPRCLSLTLTTSNGYKSNKFLKIRLIFTNFEKLDTSNKWRHFFLPQQCPPLSIYSSLFSCRTHESTGHMHITGWDLIPFLLSYFLLKMLSVMNVLHCHKKLVTYLAKTLKWLWYDTITK